MSDDLVRQSVSAWQTRLLQLDRRNALVYFSKEKRGVPLVNIEPDTLLEKLANARKGLKFLFAEKIRGAERGLFDVPEDDAGEEERDEIRVQPGDLETTLPPLELQKRLGALYKRTREWQEEQGLNVLFLALGFLNWIDEEGQATCSPILLVPCDLKHESPRDPYVLVHDESEDLSVNPTLRHKLSTAANVLLPEFSHESIAEFLAEIRQLVANRAAWSVESSVSIATFPFSKLAMWEDLNSMAKSGVEHVLVRRLAGDTGVTIARPATGSSAVPSDDGDLHGAKLDDLLDIRDQHTVVDADFSQLRAIQLARSGANLVIHGPPGTGKSQTIANTIATLLAEGKRVLFVSEKTAALDVVKRRLTEVGLGPFTLDLHSDRGKKASVYAQLRETLRQSRSSTPEFEFDRLVELRAKLNGIVRALHEVRHPLELSAFDVHGRLAALGSPPQVRVVVEGIPSLDATRLRRIHDAALRVSRRAPEFRAHHDSRWRAMAEVLPSPRLTDLIREDMAALCTGLEAVVSRAEECASACGVAAPKTLSKVSELIRLAGHLKRSRGPVPAEWLQPHALDTAKGSAEELRKETRARSRLVAEISLFLAGSLPGPKSTGWLNDLLKIESERSRWSNLAGSAWSEALLADPVDRAVQWETIAKTLRQLLEASRHLQLVLGIPKPDTTRAAADAAIEVAKRLLQVKAVSDSWTTADGIARLHTDVRKASRICEELLQAERAVAGDFGPELIDRVDGEMLVRYRTDHRSVLRWFRSAYWRDQRTVRGCLRRPRSLSLEEATGAVESAVVVRGCRVQWGELESTVRTGLGARFAGTDSNWREVEADLECLGKLYREFPTQAAPFFAILSNAGSRASLEQALATVQELAKSLDVVWTSGDPHRTEDMSNVSRDADSLAEAARTVAARIQDLSPFSVRPPSFSALIDLLQKCDQVERCEQRAASEASARARDLGVLYAGWATDFDRIDAIVGWSREFVTMAPRPVSPALLDHALNPRPAETYSSFERELSEAAKRVRSAIIAAAPRFPEDLTPWKSWDSAPLEEVIQWCKDLSANAAQAGDWLEYRIATAALDNVVGGEMVQAVRAVTEQADQVPAVVLRHVYLLWLEHVYHEVTGLQVAPKDIESFRREFAALDAKFPKAAQERVRRKCIDALPAPSQDSTGLGEMGILQRQLSLKKRQMPVRKLVTKIPNLLQRLKPCFMMSPLAVSQYLPRGASEADTLTFDAVVFDEASQIFPEDAVPAMARGRQCIVVGDQQQLPPSSFFRTSDGESPEESEEEEAGSEDRLVGVESILDVLVGMRGSGVDEVFLQVHYRSQHDALIRYSNHYFYDDRLLTFPSALGNRPGLGLHGVYLPEGRFEAGGSRTNRIEAEKVVALVFELMAVRPSSESIGVVALSRAQADLIEELIEAKRISDRTFDDRFAEAARERFFVKNLENVQGDERDHIILSIGYGPTSGSGAVPNRFGPINSDGGHRRLNVAVSRARRSLSVVHSLRPEDIHSERLGARLLRRLLEFLRQGEAAIEGTLTNERGGDYESPFEEAVGKALIQRGHRIKPQVGCAKYSIDIGILSEDGAAFDLGIECDGAAYHRAPSARDRDRLRQEILERLGWRGRIHRVWSTSWIRNPIEQVEAIEEALRKARALPREVYAPTARPPSPSGAEGPVDGKQEAPPDAGDSSPSSKEPLFQPYAEADLRGLPKGGDLRNEHPSRVADLVTAVVRQEGPVHVDLVIERVREHYRLQRAGTRVRKAIAVGVREALRRKSVAWLPAMGMSSSGLEFLIGMVDRAIRPRGPDANGAVRVIEHISDQEIGEAVLQVVNSMVGASKEAATTATTRALGYGRTGSDVERRVQAAIEFLLAEGRISERLGSLVVQPR